MARPKKYSDELRRRAIDEVLERGRKVPEVAEQLGIATPESLRRWVRQAERDRGYSETPPSHTSMRGPAGFVSRKGVSPLETVTEIFRLVGDRSFRGAGHRLSGRSACASRALRDFEIAP